MPAADVPDRFAGPHVPASSIDFSLPAVLATMALVLIVLGAFLEPVGIMMLTIPVFMPLVQSYGVDPLWMGVFILIFIELGLATPPFGLALYVMLASAPSRATNAATAARSRHTTLARRFRRETAMPGGVAELEAAYHGFESDFLAFMPELQRFAEGQAAALTSADSLLDLPPSKPSA